MSAIRNDKKPAFPSNKEGGKLDLSVNKENLKHLKVRTDLKGAAAFGIDALFVTAGIHAEELGDRSDPDAATLSGIFAAAGVAPKAVMHRLSW